MFLFSGYKSIGDNLKVKYYISEYISIYFFLRLQYSVMNKKNSLIQIILMKFHFYFLGTYHKIINYKYPKQMKMYYLGVYEIRNKILCVKSEVNNPTVFEICFIWLGIVVNLQKNLFNFGECKDMILMEKVGFKE